MVRVTVFVAIDDDGGGKRLELYCRDGLLATVIRRIRVAGEGWSKKRVCIRSMVEEMRQRLLYLVTSVALRSSREFEMLYFVRAAETQSRAKARRTGKTSKRDKRGKACRV